MNILKGAALFVFGGIIGATGAIIFLKDKYEKELNEELDLLRSAYQDKKDDEIKMVEYNDILADNKYIPYDTMHDKEVHKHVNEIADNVITTDIPPEDYPSEPIEIDETEYSERGLYFEKAEVDYYLGDGALVDEAEEMMNIEDNIGYNNIEKFISDDSKDVMYIRNAEKGIDYLVNKVSGNYSDIIGLGGDDDED